MPEGDTLYKAASRLRPALLGEELTAFGAHRRVGMRPREGETIDAVAAVGKWLTIEFSGGLTLTTHLKMTGSWHVAKSGARWPKPRHLLRARVGVDGWDGLCFNAPVVRTFATSAPLAEKPFGHLGPDLCDAEPDFDACLASWVRVATDSTTVGEILLDQRVACGVGNVYRAEVLWACGVHPYTPALQVDPECRFELLQTSHRLLRANLDTSARVTYRGGLAVYNRQRKGCAGCGGRLNIAQLGEQARTVWWCPRCQPAAGAA